jgi:glycosyltransferase involved in cell wall biosynthesis
MPAPELSVIVTTYNRPNALRAVLDGLLAQSRDDFEVIVADDGSGEPTRAVVERMTSAFAGRLRHVWHEDRGFRAAAIRNRAAAIATAPFLCFLDGDCVPMSHFVDGHLRHASLKRILRGSRVLLAEAFTAACEDGAVSVHQLDKAALRERCRLGDINRSSPLRGGFLDLVRVWVSALRPRDWKLLRGCNFAVSRDAFMAVNGFDEQFEGWGYEDSDLCIRLMNLGLRILQAPAQTCVLHLWHKENAREFKGENLARLQATLHNGCTLPARGITPPAST